MFGSTKKVKEAKAKKDKKELEKKKVSRPAEKQEKIVKTHNPKKSKEVKKEEPKQKSAKNNKTKPKAEVKTSSKAKISKTEKGDKTDKSKTITQKAGIYRVTYDKENRVWLIKRDGAKRVIDSKHTKEEALERVKELSESKDVGFVVHKKNGQFQKK